MSEALTYLTIRRVIGHDHGEREPDRWLALDETNGIQQGDCGGWGDTPQEALEELQKRRSR